MTTTYKDRSDLRILTYVNKPKHNIRAEITQLFICIECGHKIETVMNQKQMYYHLRKHHPYESDLWIDEPTNDYDVLLTDKLRLEFDKRCLWKIYNQLKSSPYFRYDLWCAEYNTIDYKINKAKHKLLTYDRPKAIPSKVN